MDAREGDEGPPRALPQRRQGGFRGRHPRGRSRRRGVRDGRRRRRLRQRRLGGRLPHRPRPEPPLQEPRRYLHGRHGQGGRRRGRLLGERPLLRLRQGRPPGPLRHALRGVVGREGPVLHARRKKQVLLHAGVLQGSEPDPLPQPGRRHVRGHDRESRRPEPDGQGSGRRDARLRRRLVAGPRRRQRHAAEPALPQQQERHVHRRRDARRGSRSARQAWRGREWGSTPPTTTPPAARAS